MVIKILSILSMVLLLSSLGCATSPVHETKYGASFETIRELPMGTQSVELAKRLGQPDLIELADNKDEYWVYLIPGLKCCSRVTFRINHSTKDLESKSFRFVDEKEATLQVFLKFFPDVKFKSARRKQTGHEIPNEIDYENDDLGIYFTVGDARQQVEDVTWINPKNRELAEAIKQ